MKHEDPLQTDIRLMLEDLLSIAKERKPKIKTLRATVSEYEFGTYLSFRALDANDNVLANYNGYIKED